MWIGLDAGNSNIVIGIFASGISPIKRSCPKEASITDECSTEHFENPRPLRTYRLSTHPIGTSDEFRARLHAVLAAEAGALTFDAHTEVVLASVVPAFTRMAREAFPRLQVIDSTWRFAFRIATEVPAQTGIDRLVNAEAVTRESLSNPENATPIIIVDSGTATTICALTQDRVFLGGAILPGIQACRDALPARAAQLFPVDLTAPAQAIGRSTESALRSGVVLGYASMIDGMIARFRRELELKPLSSVLVIATGGLAPLLREICTEIDQVDPDLTLKGIAYLYAARTH